MKKTMRWSEEKCHLVEILSSETFHFEFFAKYPCSCDLIFSWIHDLNYDVHIFFFQFVLEAKKNKQNEKNIKTRMRSQRARLKIYFACVIFIRFSFGWVGRWDRSCSLKKLTNAIRWRVSVEGPFCMKCVSFHNRRKTRKEKTCRDLKNTKNVFLGSGTTPAANFPSNEKSPRKSGRKTISQLSKMAISVEEVKNWFPRPRTWENVANMKKLNPIFVNKKKISAELKMTPSASKRFFLTWTNGFITMRL